MIRGIRETSETKPTVLSFPPDTDIDWVDLADDIKHEYFVIDNLRPSHGYKFRVAAANQGGNLLLEFVWFQIKFEPDFIKFDLQVTTELCTNLSKSDSNPNWNPPNLTNEPSTVRVEHPLHPLPHRHDALHRRQQGGVLRLPPDAAGEWE